jgi:Flp pilus assembly protein TadG
MFNPKKNNRGQVLVLVAFALIVLIGFAALAIDIGYFYHTKNQLQGAADAAALAGAIKMDGTNDTIQLPARQEAWKFACKNKAAGEAVYLVTKSSTNCDSPPASGLNEANNATDEDDIVLGNWDASSSSFNSTDIPVNAMLVKARRTSGSPGTGVVRFFGRIFNTAKQDISAQAIAAIPPRPTTSMSACLDMCATAGTSTTFFFKEQDDTTPGKSMTLGWTDYTNEKAQEFGPNSPVAQLIRGEIHPPRICCLKASTNNAAGGQIMSVLKNEFDKKKNEAGYWEVIIPVFGQDLAACPGQSETPPSGCPPGDQPYPLLVSRYAIAHITAVIANPTPSVTMTIVKCVPCPATEIEGNVPSLVK